MKNQLNNSKYYFDKSFTLGSSALSLVLAMLANNASAQSQYFEPVANGGTYSWDASVWSAPAAANAAPYTSAWGSGDFARFYNGANDAYTITLNASEVNTGLYQNSSGSTLTLVDAGSGTGNLQVIGGVQGYLVNSGETLNIDVPITGAGGIAPELSGSLYLNAANTYTGGTALGDSGNTLTYFNNGSAFGTAGITLNRTGIANFSTLLGTGGAPITVANPISTVAANTGTGTALNFAASANTPVTSSGAWTLGAVGLNLRSSGGPTSPLTISGAISGTGPLYISANNTGSATILSGANPFSGTVSVTGAGGTYGGSAAATLMFGAPNTLASASSLSLAGGTLNPGGFNQAMPTTTLGLTTASIIDFSAGAAELDFANSSLSAWSGVLNINNWNPAVDAMRFGTDDTGLTPAQLVDIEFNGAGLGTAELNAQGYLTAVPEPSTYALGLVGVLSFFFGRRQKA